MSPGSIGSTIPYCHHVRDGSFSSKEHPGVEWPRESGEAAH